MIAMILLALELVAAVVLAWQAIAHLNRAKRTTCCLFVVAWVAIGGAAASVISNPITVASDPDWRAVLLIVAVAVLSVADRRRGSE